MKDADVIIETNLPLKKEVILSASNLKYIDVAFTGVDHIDMEAVKEKGILVSNAAGYATEAVAELAVAFMLFLLRKIPTSEKQVREEGTRVGLLGAELQGKTVGLLGVGAIGNRTAQLCSAFGCKVIGYKRHIDSEKIIVIILNLFL